MSSTFEHIQLSHTDIWYSKADPVIAWVNDKPIRVSVSYSILPEENSTQGLGKPGINHVTFQIVNGQLPFWARATHQWGCLHQPVSTCWEFKDPQRAQTCTTNTHPSKGWSFTFTSHALTHSHFCVSGVHSVHTFMCWWSEKRPDWFLLPNPKRVQMDTTKKKGEHAIACTAEYVLGGRTVESLPYNTWTDHKFKTEIYCNSKYLVYK